ncbi:hypothetical protein FQN53_006923 [Emmonsiellopsis sp. PD_33]|nr:hypothetical protein FQN53_006923 [Emmonsiellopsis sp. PD_33]
MAPNRNITIDIQAFPEEIFTLVIEWLILSVGVYKAIRLRYLNKRFNSAILFVLGTREVIDVNEPLGPYEPSPYWMMTPQFLDKILLARSKTKEGTRNKALSVIAHVNRELDALTRPSEKQLQLKQHLAISEAVSTIGLHYFIPLGGGVAELDEEIKAHNFLCGAIIVGKLPLVTSLLESVHDPESRKSKVDTDNPYFGRPIHLAAAWGHLEIVRYLLDCDANPQLLAGMTDPEKYYWTDDVPLNVPARVYRSPKGNALQAAALSGHEEIVRLLLDSKPQLYSLEESVSFNRSILAAARGGHVNIITLLLQRVGKTLRDLQGLRTEIFCESVSHNQETVVQTLLENGVDWGADPLNQRQQLGRLLNLAAGLGYERIVALLLAHGASINHNGSYSGLPLSAAIRRGHEKVVQIFLDRGQSVDTALTEAARAGQSHLVRYLLRNGADIHRPFGTCSSIGLEALQGAISAKDIASVSLLIEAGVPLNYSGVPYSEVPLVFAEEWGNREIVELLVEMGAKAVVCDEQELDGGGSGKGERKFVKTLKRKLAWRGKK